MRDRRAASRAPMKEGVTWKKPGPPLTPVPITHACLRAMTMSTTRHTTYLPGLCMKFLHHIESLPHRGYLSARAGTMATTRPTISAPDNQPRPDRGTSESHRPGRRPRQYRFTAGQRCPSYRRTIFDTKFETLMCRLLRDSVQICSRLVDLVVSVGRHGGGRHRLTLAGERLIGLVADGRAARGE